MEPTIIFVVMEIDHSDGSIPSSRCAFSTLEFAKNYLNENCDELSQDGWKGKFYSPYGFLEYEIEECYLMK